MLKNKTALSLSPLALLTLAACGGTKTSGVAVNGQAQNGPLTDAWAFLDLHHGVGDQKDGDGIFNSVADIAAGITEVRVLTNVDKASTAGTDESGTFALTDLGTSDYTLAIETTAATMDSISGEAYGAGVTLKAPEGATMVTPATTMVNALMVSKDMTAAEASAGVAVALGFDAGLDLNNYDAYKAPTGTAPEIAAAKTIQFAMQMSNQQVMSVVKSFAKAGESAGVSTAASFSAAIAAVSKVVENKVVQIDAGVAVGGATTLLNFTTDMADILTLVKANVVNATGYDAAKSASFIQIAADAKTGLDVAIVQIKALVEPVGTPAQIATIKEANAKVVSAVNVISTQVEAAAKIISDGGSLADAQAKITISDTASFNTVANNPAPTGMTLSGSNDVNGVENVTISELAQSLVVGTVAGVDGFTTGGAAVSSSVVANETFTYAVVGGPTVPLFTINATTGVLSLAGPVDYETMGTNKFYEVSVSVTDSGGKSVVETFKVNIGDVDESVATYFGINSDSVVWTDYQPATLNSLGASVAAKDITNVVMSSTTGSAVTLGTSDYGISSVSLNYTNLSNLLDSSFVGTTKSPTLKFTLDSVPKENGDATIKATITDGRDGTISGTQDQISITLNVKYSGDGTTGTITVPAGPATGTYTKNNDNNPTTFTLENGDVDAFSITKADPFNGFPNAVLNVKVGTLFEAFAAAGGSTSIIAEDDSYHLAIETTLPLQNTADAVVTKFSALLSLVASTPIDTVTGTDGADAITGNAAVSQMFYGGSGTDSYALGAAGSSDYILIVGGSGNAAAASANSVTGFVDTEDKFVLEGFGVGDSGGPTAAQAFNYLNIVAGDTANDTLISVKGAYAVGNTEEYMMHVTGTAFADITIADFIFSVDDIA